MLPSEVTDRFVDEGYSQTGIDSQVTVSDDPPFAISQAARNSDVIVVRDN